MMFGAYRAIEPDDVSIELWLGELDDGIEMANGDNRPIAVAADQWWCQIARHAAQAFCK